MFERASHGAWVPVSPALERDDGIGERYQRRRRFFRGKPHGHHDGIKRDLTCLENLRLVQAMGKPQPIDLDEALEKVNLFRFGENFVSTLSAGQKRRLAMARLVVTEAKLWIMDEPFTSLDKASMAMFQTMFENHLDEGGVIVMTSHHDIEMPGSDVVRLDLSA